MTTTKSRVKILIIYICSSCLSMLTTYYTHAFRILLIHSDYLRLYVEIHWSIFSYNFRDCTCVITNSCCVGVSDINEILNLNQ